MAGFFRSLVQSVAGVNSVDFNDWVGERSNGRAHTLFFEGDLTGAFRRAVDGEAPCRGRGILLVWLHERESEDTQHLCANVWTHAGVRSELNARFVAWAGDVFRHDGSSLARVLGAEQFPTLAVVQRVQRGAPRALEWPRGYNFIVRQVLSGRINAELLHGSLTQIGDAVDAQQRQQAEYRSQLRHMQDVSSLLTQAVEKAHAEAQRLRERSEQRRRAEDEERDCFAALYESRHGGEPPPFFEGDFRQALATARSERRLLLVWLYTDCSASDALCKEVLNGEVFRAFVAEYFVLWPGHLERWLLPSQLQELLRLPVAPCLLVLRPLNVYEAEIVPWGDPRNGAAVEFPADSAWSLLGAWDVVSRGIDEEDVLSWLAEHGERATAEERQRVEDKQRAEERATIARQLREEQDRELQESLRIDRERHVPSREHVGTEADENASAYSNPLQCGAAAEAEAALIATRRSAAEALLASPQLDLQDDQRCVLVLRLPNGRRAERTFCATALLSEVYAWADCCGELSGLHGGTGSFEVPRKFTLVLTYPRSPLQTMEKSIGELGLIPNAVLALCAEDD
eukprot:TRINITY_DN40937_c0_g1_i1.p1 TRINITY_DN40937_c0_g1~~TRINITY_DN40937_c0_g1_i1.p1  ORF type:complete len:571 (+),score=98.13 TRINITY_DN40937_c0_g1_i1:69-1781(+)